MGYAELVDNTIKVPTPVSSEWRRTPLSVVKYGVTIGLTNDDSPILPVPPDGARRILAATRDNARKSRRHRAEAAVRVLGCGSDVPISLSIDPQRL
jgi:hypothetical protein